MNRIEVNGHMIPYFMPTAEQLEWVAAEDDRYLQVCPGDGIQAFTVVKRTIGDSSHGLGGVICSFDDVPDADDLRIRIEYVITEWIGGD